MDRIRPSQSRGSVQGKDGTWLTVQGLKPRADKATGYNLEVEGDHTYFVGDSGAWVHNGSRCYHPLYKEPTRYRVGVKEKVWENAVKESEDGNVRDPLTNQIISKEDKWEMGHRSGFSFKQLSEYANQQQWTRKDFLDEYHNPLNYRPELRGSNRSRRGDSPINLYGQ